MRMADVQPRQFGKYRLITKLATGGMAEIFLASYQGIGGFSKVLVVKKILPNLSEEPRFLEMFLDEARIAAMLNHPNVVQIFDLGRIGSDYFIAMEYLAGESLSYVLKECRNQKKAFPHWLAASVVAQTAEGLHHAHVATGKDGQPLGIVHRDVSPQNIFLLYDGGVKVVDFGIARATTRTTQTRTGMLKGKYAYMSPEQVAGNDLDCRSDIFSLGIVLWESLVLRKLFIQENDLDLLKAVEKADIPDPRTFRATIPEPLALICQKSMARDKERRYASANDMAVDLRRFLKTCRADWDNPALAGFMQSLCQKRIEKKKAIIDQALSDPVSLEKSLFGDLTTFSSDTEYSVPHNTPSRQPAQPHDRTGMPKVILLVVMAMLLGGGLTWLWANREPASSAPHARPPDPDRPEDAGAPPAPTPPTENEPPSPAAEDGGATDPPPDGATIEDGYGGLAAGEAAAPVSQRGDNDYRLAKRHQKPKKNSKPATAPQDNHPPPGPPGQLRLLTNPWTEVFYNGKSLGQTPLVDIELPSGRIKLRLVNRERGIEKTVTVTIEPGKKTVEKLDLF